MKNKAIDKTDLIAIFCIVILLGTIALSIYSVYDSLGVFNNLNKVQIIKSK